MRFRKSSISKHKYYKGQHRFEHWYRDNTVGFCNTQGHNMSNGIAVTWAP
jgi:hypothetical protein